MKLPDEMPEELKEIKVANNFEPDDFATTWIYEMIVDYFNDQEPEQPKE